MNLTLAQAILALPQNFRGHFDRVRHVQQFSLTDPLSITCSPACPVQADGEVIGTTPMRVECLAGKLPLLLPDCEK